MTNKDCEEFVLYLHACSDRQLLGVYEKERIAGRTDYVELVKAEADRRGVSLG